MIGFKNNPFTFQHNLIVQDVIVEICDSIMIPAHEYTLLSSAIFNVIDQVLKTSF